MQSFKGSSQNFVKQISALACLSDSPFVLHAVCPSAWNNLAPTGRIFMKFNVLIFSENLSSKKIFSLKLDKNNGYCTWIPMYIFDSISLSSF
jgi:hypothetical protein